MAASNPGASDAGGRRAHVVVVGAGFGGLRVARALRHGPVDVTLIDRHNFHTFLPLRKVSGLGPTLGPDGVIGAAEAQKAFAEFKAGLKCHERSRLPQENGP